MKKIMVFIALFFLCTNLVYAKMDADILVKGGILASPYLNLDGDVADVDIGFILGAEGYIFPWDNLGLGLGVTHLFDTDIENTAKKISATNFYLTAKPKISFEGKEITALYFIGQLGFSSTKIKLIDGDGVGVYVAGGVGIEAKWLIIEAIYSYTNWAIAYDTDQYKGKRAALYTLGLNVGYKFSI